MTRRTRTFENLVKTSPDRSCARNELDIIDGQGKKKKKPPNLMWLAPHESEE